MVGTTGFEPAASPTPRVRATRLRYVPTGWSLHRATASQKGRFRGIAAAASVSLAFEKRQQGAQSVSQIEQCFAIDRYAVGKRGGETTTGKFLGAGRLVPIDWIRLFQLTGDFFGRAVRNAGGSVNGCVIGGLIDGLASAARFAEMPACPGDGETLVVK